jgi:metallo-beta-lactamase family protein
MLDTGRVCCLVDCGMFQGNKTVRDLNNAPFPFDARTVQFLLLTHAHTDHTGLIPKLIRTGFDGPIYATEATADLLQFMMRDSAKIQEADTARRNRWAQRRGKPVVEPLFTLRDAEEALERLETIDYGQWFEPVTGFHTRYWNAGHILGSASVEIKFDDPGSDHTMRLLFSGDLGPDEKAFHPEPDAEAGFDYIVCESTYGDRERDDYTLAGRRKALRAELMDGLARGGNIVVPCFAVERTQELLHDIGVLLATNELPGITVFLDSPLARKVTEVFVKHAHTFDDTELPEDELFRDERFRIVENVEESKAINRIKGGAIIISASGMADAGRIQHHLKQNIWRDDATILFVGYQAPGTTGHLIQNGADDVRIHGKEYKIRATVRSIGNYSAHADQSELADWITGRTPLAGGVFLNHGDDDARGALKSLLAERGLAAGKVFLPAFDETFELTAGPPHSKGRGPRRIPTSELQRDWYNDYAAFLIALENRMDEKDTDEHRRELLAKLNEVLGR